MIKTMEKNYCDYLEQCNITDTDDDLRPKSGQQFHSKFIRQIDNLKGCQENIKQKTNDIRKMDSFQEENCEKFQREYLSVNTVTQASTYSGKSHTLSQKEYNYKGHVIKGKLRRRQLNGDISIVYSNGKQFQGLYENGRMKEGRFDFKNGYEYCGQLEGKEFNGKGTLKCPDGKRITGIWKDEQLVGRAEIQYPQGDVYYGQVDNFMKHGNGCLVFKSGSKYIGNFERGQINGYGTYFQTDGKCIKGVWKDGELVREDDVDSSMEDIYIGVSELKKLF